MTIARLHRSSSAPPPRTSSAPPPASSPRHVDLSGATGPAVHFRSARLGPADVTADLACQFGLEGVHIGPLEVLDVSTTGFATSVPADLEVPPGTSLDGVELLLQGRSVWSGDATVIHSVGGRLGARFTSGVVDVNQLRSGLTLEGRLAIRREQSEHLPAEWRAAVGDLRQLLDDVKAEIEQVERAETHDPMRRSHDEARLFETLLSGWGKEFFAASARLHEMSKSLGERASILGHAYASSMLAPLLMACPMHRRAYEKPLGYSGDYRMMELCYATELGGDGLYGRFLHSLTQSYTFVRTVRAREEVIRKAVRGAMLAEGEGPVKILAVAAGPAIEIRHLLEEIETLDRPIELTLLDQDPAAHEAAQRHLFRVLYERHRGTLPLTVRSLHFSVRQLLRPMTDEELAVRRQLDQLDLIYSAGLYDYLTDAVAVRLTQMLYGRLRPGGRLLIGNLIETPDSTWMMDYVCDWKLIYRTPESMLGLARRLSPAPSRIGITRDTTDRCLFLDATTS